MSWPIVKLVDITEVITKGTTPTTVGYKFQEQGDNYIKIEAISEDGTFIPEKFKKISVECNNALKRSQLKSGDVLFSITGALGRTALVTKKVLPANTNQNLAIIRLKDNVELDKRFLQLALSTNVTTEQIKKNQAGVAQQALSLTQVKSFEIPLPPFPEQKRIVALLDTVFADLEQTRTKTEQNLKNSRELFDSYLQQVFSQKGEGWSVKKVSDIADTCLGKMLDKKKNKGNFKPYLRNLNVQWFNINTSNLLDMKFEDSEYERYAVKKGDLVICEGGYPGRGAIWEQDEDILFQKALHRIRSHDVIYNQWILYYLYLSDCNGSLKNNFTGAGIQHFTGKALKQLSLPVPDKVKAEKYIHKMDALLEQVKLLEIIYNKKLDSIDELKKSILHKAFSGELTATAE